MEMNAIAAGLLPVGLAIALGALARRFLIPDEADWAGLNKITFYLLVPGLVISTLANADIAAIPVREIAQALVLAAALVALALGAVYAATPKTAEAKAGYSSLFQTATRWNAAVALGVTGEMYGAVALTVIALSMLVLMPAVNVVNIALLTRLHSERRLRLGESLWKVLSNPIIVGCLLGLAVALPGVSVWPPLMNVVDALADASIAAILLIVGAGLRLSNWSAPRAAPQHRAFVRAQTGADAALHAASRGRARPARRAAFQRGHSRGGADRDARLCAGARDGRRRAAVCERGLAAGAAVVCHAAVLDLARRVGLNACGILRIVVMRTRQCFC